jgi:hypothetical protein
MPIRLRRHGVSGQVQDEVAGLQTPGAVLHQRLALAHEMLTLAATDVTTLPQGQQDALVEIIRRLTRLQTWCAAHQEGETL